MSPIRLDHIPKAKKLLWFEDPYIVAQLKEAGMPIPGDPVLEQKIEMRNRFTAYVELAVRHGILAEKYVGGYPEGVMGRTHLAAALRFQYENTGKFKDLEPEDRRRYAVRIFDIHNGTTVRDWEIILEEMSKWLTEKLGPAAMSAAFPAAPTQK